MRAGKLRWIRSIVIGRFIARDGMDGSIPILQIRGVELGELCRNFRGGPPRNVNQRKRGGRIALGVSGVIVAPAPLRVEFPGYIAAGILLDQERNIELAHGSDIKFVVVLGKMGKVRQDRKSTRLNSSHPSIS